MISQETNSESPVEADTGPQYCPHCGAKELKMAQGGFVEAGEYIPHRGYENEGDAHGYLCKKCGKGFIDFQPEPDEEEHDNDNAA